MYLYDNNICLLNCENAKEKSNKAQKVLYSLNGNQKKKGWLGFIWCISSQDSYLSKLEQKAKAPIDKK